MTEMVAFPTASYLSGARDALLAGELGFLAHGLIPVEVFEGTRRVDFTLTFLELAKRGVDDFAGVAVATRGDELLDEAFKMGGELQRSCSQPLALDGQSQLCRHL